MDITETTVDEMKSRDLSPSLVAREKKPKPTWFVERGDGMIFPCEEKEAWDIIHNHSQWKRHDFKFIGYSDGTTYARMVAASMVEAQKLEPEVARLKNEVMRYRTQEDRLMLEEVIDMEGDPSDTYNEANKAKILRLRSIMQRLDEQLEATEKKYRTATADAVKDATAAELKVARENWKIKRVYPSDDLNIFTPMASPKERQKIISKMNG